MNFIEEDNYTIEKCNDRKKYWIPIITGFLNQNICEYIAEKNFKRIKMPIINPAVTTKEINIGLSYHDEKLELSSSSALRMGAASAIYDKVFSCMTVVRNELDVDRIHLMEFELLEAEWKCSDYEKMIDFIEDIVHFSINIFNQYVVENKLEDLFSAIKIDKHIKRIQYSEVPELLLKANVPVIPEELGVFYDNALTKILEEPIWVMYYPPEASWRAKCISKDKALIFNLIMPFGYGELVECSIRETNPDIIKRKFEYANIIDSNVWYIKALQNDCSPRAGFGLGLERLSNWLTRSDDIASTQLFTRKSIIAGGKNNVSLF